MPQPRKYSTNADKQAAYRARRADKKPPRESLLAAQARTLHGTIHDKARAADELAQAVAGDRADVTLQKLIEYFKAR
jgi:hypothetical protein